MVSHFVHCSVSNSQFLVTEVEHIEIVEPIFSISSSKHIHIIFNDIGGMELSPRWLPLDLGRVEVKVLSSILQVYEYNIIQNFKSIPPSKNHNFTIIKLSRMTHSGLGLPLYLWDRPLKFF